jgi:hypothetical protein
MKSIHQDERIVAQKRKIGNETFLILFYGLLITVLIQQYLFNLSFPQYMPEVILLIIASAYFIIRNIVAGNNLFGNVKNNQKNVILVSIACGLVVVAANTARNSLQLGNLFTTDMGNTVLIGAVTFISATLLCFIVFEILYVANKTRQKQLDEKYKDADD